MSWLFSQVLVEEYLGDICLDGGQSVQSNGKHTQQAYLSQDKMTKYSRLSRFGMTFKPLTESLGEELLMLYLADFHARTLVPLEMEQELQEQEAQCGDIWHGLLARLDQNTHLWKIPQCSLLEDLEQSLEIWPQWGTMRNGVCWEQMTLEQTITENEYGYWPTSTAGLSKHGATLEYWNNRIAKGRQSDTHMEVLRKMWGTPKAQDSRHASWDRGKSNLGEQVAGIHNGGHLNPTWTEWLMGWPLEWTDLKPLEMDKSHCVQQLHGTSLKEE